ncbi:MAG TPA: CPBP family intramembrane glutamic endopeptidase [Lysobacter sp.]
MIARPIPERLRHLRHALLFIVLVLALSWGLEAFIVAQGGVRELGPAWLVALMWIPGAVAIGQRLAFRLGFADAGFRIGPLRWYAVAVAVPLLLALLAAIPASLLDLREAIPVAAPMLASLAPVALVVLGMGVVGAVGEEIGWRGFLLPRLVAARVRRPNLACNLVWALWHLPLIALGGFYQTETPWLMAAVYATGIVAIGFFLGELRLRSGSVWVAALAHAAHNFFFQFAVPALLLTAAGANAAWWDLLASDTGLIVAALYAGVVVAGRNAGRRVTD